MPEKRNLKQLFAITFTILLIGSFFYPFETSFAQDINIKNFCTAIKMYIDDRCPRNDHTYNCPVNGIFYSTSASYGAWSAPGPTYGRLRDYYQSLDCNNEQKAKEIIDQFLNEFCPQYANKDTVLDFLCKEWENPTENGQNLINAVVKPGGNINLISSYQVGKKIGEDLAEDSKNCTMDADIGFIDFLKNPISWFFRLIFWVFAYILEFIANVFLFVLTPENFGGFVNFQPVKIIWTVTRNLANLGIILGFVFTAIATILKIEKYSWDKMLWRLVLVALLVNFSLVICGMLVDLSNFLITFFINGASDQVINFPTLLKYTATKIACSGVGQGFWYETATAVIGIIVAIIFIGQVIGLIIYAVTRIVTLWLTLGLSPLGFLSMAFPGAEKIAQTWRNFFTQALISLPIIAFSFFIVLVMLNAVATSYFTPIVADIEKTFVQNIISLIAYAVIIIILSQATLTIAGAIGVQQVQKGYQWVNKTIWGALGFAGGAAVGATTKSLVGSETWRKTAESLEKSNLKLAHSLGTTMKDVSQKTREGELSNLSKRADKMTDDQVRQEIKRYMKWNDRRSTAVLVDKLVERGKLSTGDPNDKENIKNIDDKALAFAKDYVNVSQLKKVNPYEYVKYYSKDEDIKKHLEDIRRESPNLSPEQEKQELYNRLLIDYASTTSPEKLAEGRWQEIFDYIKNSQENEKLGNDKLIEVLNKLVKNLTPEAMAAIARSMETNQQYTFIENVKKAVEPEASAVGKSARDYLLENKGYGSLRYFQGTLGRVPTEPKEESYSDGYKLHKVDKDKGIWLPPSNPPKGG